jgi:hypothetical protein
MSQNGPLQKLGVDLRPTYGMTLCRYFARKQSMGEKPEKAERWTWSESPDFRDCREARVAQRNLTLSS